MGCEQQNERDFGDLKQRMLGPTQETVELGRTFEREAEGEEVEPPPEIRCTTKAR